MVNIKKGKVNFPCFSLSELSICGEPETYRMVFTSENSEGVSYEIVKSPVSSSKRLQIFEIEEGVDVTFEFTGYYRYEIFQNTSDNLVETGLLRVYGDEKEIPVIPSNKSIQVYGRQ